MINKPIVEQPTILREQKMVPSTGPFLVVYLKIVSWCPKDMRFSFFTLYYSTIDNKVEGLIWLFLSNQHNISQLSQFKLRCTSTFKMSGCVF